MTWGTGTAGPLTARFCALRVRPTKGRGDRWLLCERSATDERKYYLLHLPATTPLVDLVALARSRWPIEQQYRELKDDLGLDHFEGRTYQGWTHHVVLTAVAFTFFQIERGRATVEPRPTLPVVRGWVREIMGLLYVVHNRRLLSMLDSFRRNAPLRRWLRGRSSTTWGGLSAAPDLSLQFLPVSVATNPLLQLRDRREA